MKKNKGNKGKWNETEVAMLCDYLDEGLSVEDIAERFVDIRTLAQIKTKIKSKAIQERHIDSDIEEMHEDLDKEEEMEEHLEKVKDVLEEKIAEVKKTNNKMMFRLVLITAVGIGVLIQMGIIK
tara:strand:+ start:524 stop:895 length:372 start_codon:yes stop_codon:yes gene_type:complete